ncbi:MAG: hypothetical protein O7B79_15280 [SAR324 cluster bacterium]|nr:hypothetical protein [SAR324 cluster bacterium]
MLKPGGEFIFTDLMQADQCPEGVLQPILDRLLLENMASPGYCRGAAARVALRELSYEDLTPHLTTHYAKVLDDMESLAAHNGHLLDENYVQRARTGLHHWVEGGDKGYLAWGVFHFQA